MIIPKPKPRTLALLVVAAHWIVAVSHLFLAAKILSGPNDVSWLGITWISLGHCLMLVAVRKLGDRLAGVLLFIFFLAALGSDVYEHFLHAAANNVFMVAPGDWTVWFDTSVFALLALEILGCSLAFLSLRGKKMLNPPTRATPLSC